MRLRYGSYLFPVNGVEVATSQTTLRSDATIPYGQRRRMEVHGYLEGSGQEDLSSKADQLKLALRKPYQNLELLTDGNKVTDTNLKAAFSLTGVVVTEGPNFPSSRGAEYSLQREFTFVAEADYFLPGLGNFLMAFKETLTFRGGKPVYVMKRALDGPPQRQKVWAQTEYYVSQAGEAVSFQFPYPDPAPPLFPQALKEAGTITRTGPDRTGPDFYQNYRTSWQYEFESVTPLSAQPNVWK